MRRQGVLNVLTEHNAEIRGRFGLKRLAIFGSIARDEARDDSDIDVLIEFQEGQATLENYMDLKFYLEDEFGTTVDLVTDPSIRPVFRPYVERDVIEIA